MISAAVQPKVWVNAGLISINAPPSRQVTQIGSGLAWNRLANFFGGGQALFAFHLVGDIQQSAGHTQRRAVLITVQAGTAFEVA